jgi:hypothetical protein
MEKKIPKIIHYCWLSKDEKPQLINDCIQSWKVYMPDYDVMCWDQERFDVNSVPFVLEAVRAKKWAFAADYIRLYALYNYGGIYLDSDVMVYKSFDPFLSHGAFSSIEFMPTVLYREILKKGLFSKFYAGNGIEAAVMGAEKGHSFFRVCLDYYDTLVFRNDPKFYHSIVLPQTLAKIANSDYGFKFIPTLQMLKDNFVVYPPDVFSCSNASSILQYSQHMRLNSWGADFNTLTLKGRIRSKIIHFVSVNFPNLYKKITSLRVA